MKTALLFLLACSLCPAGTIYDVFDQSQAGGCNYSFSAPYGVCDVIGDPALYDIQKATVEIGSAESTVTLYFNYGGGISLQPFMDGLELHVGDLFFYAPDDPAHYLFGIPLASHGSFQAGDLYQVGGSAGLLTADQILNNSGYYYRRDQDVWLSGSGTPIATGSPVQVVRYGDGVTSAEYAATVQFPTPTVFLDEVVKQDRVGIDFASAYCGNDVIQGVVESAPEPGGLTLVLVGTVLIGAAIAARRRKRAR
jgi:hypothetical protein